MNPNAMFFVIIWVGSFCERERERERGDMCSEMGIEMGIKRE